MIAYTSIIRYIYYIIHILMIKKILPLMFVIVFGVSSARAFSPQYKGFADMYTGISALAGMSTSHGLVITDGLFVGAGGDIAVSPEHYTNPMVLFAEGRYKFMKNRISPFVILRAGGGLGFYHNDGCYYISQGGGCSFDLTEKFGFDASITTSLYNSTFAFSFRVGIHF